MSSDPEVAAAEDIPWVEKYRPDTVRARAWRAPQLDAIVGNSDIVGRLRSIARDGNMNNMILAGPPGTGKTTSILCLARAMLGPAVREAVLELNASDDRGIDVVRNKIKAFAKTKVTLPAGCHKIVILDEADSMTAGAQQALRRTMEVFSATTRFALACNNSTKIIEPIQSRCAILRYARLEDAAILRRMVEVCEAEHVPYDAKGLEAILFTADGDMRQALNNLQSTFAGFGVVNETNVFKVCDQPHPLTVRRAVEATLESKIDEAIQWLSSLWTEGYSAIDIVGTVARVVKQMETLPEALLYEYLRDIGFTQARIADGVGTQLQLLGLCARLCDRAREYREAGGKLAKTG